MEINFKFPEFALLTTKAHRKGMELHQRGAYPTPVSMILTVIEPQFLKGLGYVYYCRVEHVGHDQSLSSVMIRLHEGELTDDLSPVEPEEQRAVEEIRR